MAVDDAGRPAEAVELLTRGLKLFRDLGETARLVPGLHSLSNVHYNLGELDAAVAVANEALEIAPTECSGHISLINRGAALRLQGYFAEAEADLTTALTMTDRPAVAGFYELSWLYADLARFSEAESNAVEALRISRRDEMEWHEAASLNALGSAVLGLRPWRRGGKASHRGPRHRGTAQSSGDREPRRCSGWRQWRWPEGSWPAACEAGRHRCGSSPGRCTTGSSNAVR